MIFTFRSVLKFPGYCNIQSYLAAWKGHIYSASYHCLQSTVSNKKQQVMYFHAIDSGRTEIRKKECVCKMAKLWMGRADSKHILCHVSPFTGLKRNTKHFPHLRNQIQALNNEPRINPHTKISLYTTSAQKPFYTSVFALWPKRLTTSCGVLPSEFIKPKPQSFSLSSCWLVYFE